MKFRLQLSIFISVLWMMFIAPADAFGKQYSVRDIPNVQLQDKTRLTSNPDNILSPAAVTKIDSMLYALKNQGKAEVVVVAVNSIDSDSPKDFVHTLFNEWKLGKKGSDNGLAVLLVLDQGAIEIETGYGLEGDLPDAICKRIINTYMLPHFRQQDWDGGMVGGVRAIYDILNGLEPAGWEEPEALDSEAVFVMAMILILIGAPILILVFAAYKKTKCPRCGKHTLRRSNSKIVQRFTAYSIVETTYVCSNCGYTTTKRTKQHNDNSHNGGGPIIFGGGGFGGGRGGGGFGGGGFGGGMSGGGGAGGRF